MQRWATATALGVLLPAVALAGGMRIEPGKWEFTSVAQMPMLPAPKTTTLTRCIAEAETDPQAFMEQAEDCEVSEIEADAASMRWKMVCNSAGGRMVGETAYTSSGTSVRGTTTMTIDAGGHSMKIETATEGRRLGPCD